MSRASEAASTQADVLEAVRTESRMITTSDLSLLFDVTERQIGLRMRRGDLPKPRAVFPHKWSPGQIARFLDSGETA